MIGSLVGSLVVVVIGIGMAGTGGRMSVLHCAEEVEGSVGGGGGDSYRSHYNFDRNSK
jgi:hypothetical protein